MTMFIKADGRLIRRIIILVLMLGISVWLSAIGVFADKAASPNVLSPATTAHFAIIGDYGTSGQAEQDVSNLVHGWSPEFIITTGDNNYFYGDATTIDANIGQYYHDFIYPYTGSYGQGATYNQFFPCLGNHDWYTAGAIPYLNYFTLPNNERYYDFAWGPVHFFCIDSDGNEPDGILSTSTQANWLHNALAAATEPWKLVYFHHPPYSSGSTHGSTSELQWPFQQWGASIVLSGHEHNYERIIRNGFPYIVNGLGGTSLYAFGATVSGSVVRYNSNYGAMDVHADATSMNLQFISRTGSVIDNYTLGNATSSPTNTPIATPTRTPTKTYTPAATSTPTNIPYTGTCPGGNGLFTLYYGYIQNPASSDTTLQTIASAQPNFLVVGDGLEARSDIPAYLHGHSVEVLQYIPMHYGLPDFDINARVDTAMMAGYDGIFFDETSADGTVYAWNSALAGRVRSYGSAKMVIMNPGTVLTDPSMFNYADIVSVENQYNSALPGGWGVPAWRWLAVQGDPANIAAVSAADAESRLATFRSNGGFWYYSSEYAPSGSTAIYLPPWYTTFATWAKQQTSPPCQPHVLVGHLTWPGRPAQPDPSQVLPLSVTLRLNTGGPASEYTDVTTDSSGFFTAPVGFLTGGSYKWRVKGSTYLAVTGTLTLSVNTVTNTEMGLQKAGDIDGNNNVDISDFNILKGAFGKLLGHPNYDPRADYDGNNFIGLSDFTLQKDNFGRLGAEPIRPAGR